MANVATGIPLGIWTMLYSESMPWRCRLATGTPSTGTVVLAASIPGRCAAPAGTGDDGLQAASGRFLRIGEHVVGHAMGR